MRQGINSLSDWARNTESVARVTIFNQSRRNFARKLYFSQVFRKNLQYSRARDFVDLLA